jgi:hypothetical protein
MQSLANRPKPDRRALDAPGGQGNWQAVRVAVYNEERIFFHSVSWRGDGGQTIEVSAGAISAIISFGALCVSLITFRMTYRQKSIDEKYTTRKSLTDVIAELTKINISFAQLEIDHPGSSDERVVSFRRNYNDQRRYLANHGELLCNRIPEIVNDVDCMIIGAAFASHGDYKRAERFHKLAVEKSITNAIRMNNMRALAGFYFRRGNVALARKTYEEALQVELPSNDSMRQFTADTYMMWARAEQYAGFWAESQRLRASAEDAARLIGQKSMRDDMIKQIEALFDIKA